MAILSNYVVLFPATVLLASSALKTHGILTGSLNWDFQACLEVCLISLQLLLTVSLALGRLRKTARITGIALFSFFTVVACAKFLQEDPNCGCFGTMKIKPGFVVIVDLICLFCLWVWDTGKRANPFVSLSTMIVGVLLFLVVGQLGPIRSILDPGVGGFVRVHGKEWIGSEFPLTEYIELPVGFSEGSWMVVFYSWSCLECNRFTRLAEESRFELPVVMVEIPPSMKYKRTDGGMVYWRELSPKKEWLLPTPLVVVIQDGIVVDVNPD